MDDNNEKKVPVYTNVPIGNDDIDYVGLKTYANHIDAALRKSNTIGVIGDFGTGKSSLIEYLKNNRLKDRYQVAPINLWNVNKETSNRNIDVHIHFLYQLALCLTSQRFAKSINRRVNITILNNRQYMLLPVVVFIHYSARISIIAVLPLSNSVSSSTGKLICPSLV